MSNILKRSVHIIVVVTSPEAKICVVANKAVSSLSRKDTILRRQANTYKSKNNHKVAAIYQLLVFLMIAASLDLLGSYHGFA